MKVKVRVDREGPEVAVVGATYVWVDEGILTVDNEEVSIAKFNKWLYYTVEQEQNERNG